MTQTWFITGCSAGGIGAGIASEALKGGYNVVVTARNLDKVQSIIQDYPEAALALTLDLTDEKSIQKAVEKALEKFGRIDVLLNNAGYCYRSSVEEAEPGQVVTMFETNFFGPITLIKAVLPGMRKNHSGVIINISSIGAVRTSSASGYYAASKAALELLSEALSAELSPLGIDVMVVEPGAFRTHFYDSSLKGAPLQIEDYAGTAWMRSPEKAVNQQNQPGDPQKAGKVLIEALKLEKKPFRLLLGSDAIKAVETTLQNRLEELHTYSKLSQKTDF